MFAEGIYFVKISYSNGMSTTKKIVKQYGFILRSITNAAERGKQKQLEQLLKLILNYIQIQAMAI